MQFSQLCLSLVVAVVSSQQHDAEEDYDPYLRFLEQSMSMPSVENEEGEGPKVYPTNLPDNYKINAMFTTSAEDTNYGKFTRCVHMICSHGVVLNKICLNCR